MIAFTITPWSVTVAADAWPVTATGRLVTVTDGHRLAVGEKVTLVTAAFPHGSTTPVPDRSHVSVSPALTVIGVRLVKANGPVGEKPCAAAGAAPAESAISAAAAAAAIRVVPIMPVLHHLPARHRSRAGNAGIRHRGLAAHRAGSMRSAAGGAAIARARTKPALERKRPGQARTGGARAGSQSACAACRSPVAARARGSKGSRRRPGRVGAQPGRRLHSHDQKVSVGEILTCPVIRHAPKPDVAGSVAPAKVMMPVDWL